MHQALPYFDAQFPGLEMSAVFVMDPTSNAHAKAKIKSKEGTTSGGDQQVETEIEIDKVTGQHYVYIENGLVPSVWPTSVHIEVPIFERLSATEEAKLGAAGIRKSAVGKLVLEGKCKYGCAMVELGYMRVEKVDGEVVWEKKIRG
ncbi:hypothetical protein HDU76_007029 [Blyttiomyces sp. JEL0837]|nr:hypothetical protein HDU76_007029 [Blyttiomyces sp. JEL0837]